MIALPRPAISEKKYSMDRHLLPLKIAPPPPQRGSLLRPNLQALLSEARLQPVTLVVAPAGFGKTTMLAQWAQELRRTNAQVCWLSLDDQERDPALFLAYLIRSFQASIPGIGIDAWRILNSAAKIHQDWPLIASALCQDLQSQLVTTTVLILDDLHLVTNSAVITQILSYFLRAAPPTLHTILASRRMPSFAPLSRLRAEGQLLEISQRDLNLDAEELRQLLTTYDLSLPDDAIKTLLNRTEGWALSLKLAARAISSQPTERQNAFVQELQGNQDQLLRYLSHEVLSDLPADVLEFLRFAALPHYFDVALLEEVLQRDDIAYLLQRAQSLGLPITSMETNNDQRLHFHTMWRDMLLGQLNLNVNQTSITKLHLRLGHIFEQRKDLEAALEHYAHSNALEDMVRALTQQGWELLHSPRRERLRRLIEALPEHIRENNPEILYMWGYSQMTSEPQLAILRMQASADLFHKAEQYQRELRVLADLTTLFFLETQLDQVMVNAMRSVRVANLVRDEWSRGAALVCVAAMLFVQGRELATLGVAQHAFAQPINIAWYWLLSMLVTTTLIRLGRPTEALQVVDRALGHHPKMNQDDRLRQNLLRQQAIARFYQGYTAEAVTQAIEVHRYLSDYYHSASAAVSAQQLALLLCIQGRFDESLTYLNQARSAFHERGQLLELAKLQAIELYSQILREHSVRTPSAALETVRRLNAVESGTRSMLFRMLMAIVLGESGEQRSALALLQSLNKTMLERGYRLFLASGELYEAHLHLRSGQSTNSDSLLRSGFNILKEEHINYVPFLPAEVIQSICQAAILAGIETEIAGRVLVAQSPEQVATILGHMQNHSQPAVRLQAARLAAALDAALAFPILRSLSKDRHAEVRQLAEDSLHQLIYKPPYPLAIRLLGAFVVVRGELEIRDRDWRSSKARQFFQILLTEQGRAVPRDYILDLLWPDMDTSPAINNLRVTLNRLSKALEPDRPEGAPSAFILQQGDTFSINPAADITLDTTQFAQKVDEGSRAFYRGQRREAMAILREAMQLYGGSYLPDALYDDWSTIERERMLHMFTEAALLLGEIVLDEGHAHEAIGLAWRVIEQERSNEQAYRLLMRAHASLGERNSALRLYQRLVKVLQEDLDVEPMVETRTLFKQIRTMG